MGTRYSISVVAEDPEKTVAAARAAEAASLDLLYTGDIQSTHRGAYTTLTLTATVTSRITLGPGVTNPATRNPAVTAGAIASLDEISGGQTFLDLGTGDRAVRNLGLRAATVARTEHYLAAARSFHSTGRAVLDGVEAASRTWTDGSRCSTRRTDRRTYASPARPPTASSPASESHLRPCSTCANMSQPVRRKPGEIRPRSTSGSWPTRRSETRPDRRVPASPRHSLQAGTLLARSPARATVHDRYRAPLKPLAADYIYTSHMHAGGGSRTVISRIQLGLVDYPADRFALAGDPGEVRDQVRKHRERGVDRFWLIDDRPGLASFLDAWGQEIVHPDAAD